MKKPKPMTEKEMREHLESGLIAWYGELPSTGAAIVARDNERALAKLDKLLAELKKLRRQVRILKPAAQKNYAEYVRASEQAEQVLEQRLSGTPIAEEPQEDEGWP